MMDKHDWERYHEFFANPKEAIAECVIHDTNKRVNDITEQLNKEYFWEQLAAKLSPKIDTSLGDIDEIREQVARVAEEIERDFGIVIDQEKTIKSVKWIEGDYEWKNTETEETFMRKKLRSAGIYHEPNEKRNTDAYKRMMAKKKAKNRKKRRNK